MNPNKRARQQFVELLSDTTEQGQWIPRAYVLALGGYDISAVFCKLLFWSKHGKRNDGLFWKSDVELANELGLTPGKVRRLRDKLVERGLFERQLKRATGSPTNHYRPCYDNILNLLFDHVDGDNNAWGEVEYLFNQYLLSDKD